MGDKKKKESKKDRHRKAKQPRIRYVQGKEARTNGLDLQEQGKKSLNPSAVTMPAVSFICGMRDADEDVNGRAAAPTHSAGFGALFNV